MAEIEKRCCTSVAQETCCEPGEKASCCDESNSCGCAAGTASAAALEVRETVREKYTAAARAAAGA